MKPIPALTEEQKRRFYATLMRDKETGCLLWTGLRNDHGYGTFRLTRVDLYKAHRIAFVLAGGVIKPEAPEIMHLCDNPACCEPAHLRSGSHTENVRDMAAKGRGSRSRCGLPHGVTRRGSGYVARHWTGSKTVYLGTYPTPEEAALAADHAKSERLAAGG